MTPYLTTVAAFCHATLQSGVVLDRVRTENQIWAELLAVGLAVPLYVLWAIAGGAL